jgi:hypothetical protein
MLGNSGSAKDSTMRFRNWTTVISPDRGEEEYKVAAVVSLAFIFRDPFEGTSLGEVLWVFLYKVLERKYEQRRLEGTFVSSHNVSMVSLYSWRDIVNPYL